MIFEQKFGHQTPVLSTAKIPKCTVHQLKMPTLYFMKMDDYGAISGNIVTVTIVTVV